MANRISVLVLAMAACAFNVNAQSPRALEVLQERLLPLFEIAGVVFTDVDESTGRMRVGVVHRDVEGLVREKLPVLGILSRLVDVVETDAIFPVTTLQDGVRPVVGGLQIRFSNYVCTLGFTATRAGVDGFVTNNHCSGKQGMVDGMNYYQPLNQVTAELIGTEIADPPYFKGNWCPRGKQCRYSDSLFARSTDGVAFDRGKIAKTTGLPNSLSLTIGGNFSFTGTDVVATGALVNKVGRTTGWTEGKVTAKCANVAVSGTNIINLCQDIVENNVKIVGGGDSGSAVFAIDSGDTVKLVGLLWGGNTSGTMFVYSQIEWVQKELGLTVIP